MATDGQYLVDLYCAAKKMFYGAYSKAPYYAGLKKGDAENLFGLAVELDKREWDGVDYLQFHFEQCKRRHIFPSTKWLLSEGAFNAYKAKLNRDNLRRSMLYHIEGDTFIVNRTGRKYDLHQVENSIHQDSYAHFAHQIIYAGTDIAPKMWHYALECLEYYLAKLAYKGKVPPVGLIETIAMYREKLNSMENGYGTDSN
jgi:hypothetical protein